MPPDASATQKPRGIGFVGLSTQGWAAAALASPLFHPLLVSKYTLVALCTRSAASASTTASHYTSLYRSISSPTTVTAYHGPSGIDALIGDSKVDIVAVSVKIPDHFDIVKKAIEAGKDVFVEWTPGNGYEETKRIGEMARERGVRVLVGAQASQGTAVRKVKEILEDQKIGRVLSTTVLLTAPAELLFWGPRTLDSARYLLDATNNTTILTIHAGHFLTVLEHVLGSFAEITASATSRFTTSQILNSDGTPTGETVPFTSPDQVALSGTLTNGVFVNIHIRAGVPGTGARGAGRKLYQWIIDGEDGTVEVVSRPVHGDQDAFFNTTERDVYLNGVKIDLGETELDELDQTGKAWWEFAKGDGEGGGMYATIEQAVRIHGVLDAASRSVVEEKRVVL